MEVNMYHFIINPKSSSGRGIRHWWTVKEELDKKEIAYTAALTEYSGHATVLAREICSKDDTIKNIIVLGGDGTFNEVINGIDDYNKVLLGYVPSGSSNDFARALRIPKDPLQALANILKPSKFKYLDYGVVNFFDDITPPRKFACNSGIGYDANVCNEVQSSPWKKRLNRIGAGKFVYFAIAFKQLLTIKPLNATVIADGMKKSTYAKVLLVSSMIHKFEGGGLAMAPKANPCDGKLSVCLVHGLSRAKALLLLPTIITGNHVRFKGVETFDCSEIEIITDRDASVHTEGEIPNVCSHIKVHCFKEQIRMIL
jgi:YegS/Rv2252/BmrU family lipid kinase